METIGDILRNHREKSKLLLRQAAALLEIDQAILSKIERNERKATKEQLILFAKIYKLNLEKLQVLWLGEKIYKNIENEDFPLKALKVAEEKIKYKTKNKK
jgi:transcriptional regulator with XRE-family HTH domain